MSFSTATTHPPAQQAPAGQQVDEASEQPAALGLEPVAGEWVVKGASGMTEHVPEPRGAEFFKRTVTPDVASAALKALEALRHASPHR